MRRSRVVTAILWAGVVVLAAAVSGCGAYYPPHMRPLSSKTRALLAEKGMTASQPILIRVFKSESELEVWKKKDDGHFYHLKTYPICNFSGGLGPKLKQGDLQAPEGFYVVNKKRLNPKSRYHLSFNIGYPNVLDRSLKRTGANLMVHGECKSRGCYAMTDAVIEEIYALAVEAFAGGQEKFQVHAFPFRMTTANLAAHTDSSWFDFWLNLKDGYDYFQVTRLEPTLAVCGGRYVVNGAFPAGKYPNPKRACPRYSKLPMVAFKPKSQGRAVAESSLAKPLGSIMDLHFGEITPVYNVMTLGPATPDLKAKGQKQAANGKKEKIAQRAP
ncbi:MAG: murein L,D-transpeptidase family protein [Methyloceanibacter sp.]|uniref:L,D-transpeptidase family protein n=1 Tax=Methyloceanibacter sp. TaxID=1965321 RepID=UPI003C545C7A